MTNWITTTTEHATQYGLLFDGHLDLVVTSGDRAVIEDHIARGVAAGIDPARYGIAHRAIVRHPWAPTTYDQRKAIQQAADVQRAPGIRRTRGVGAQATR